MLENISSMFWTLLMCQGVNKIKLIEEIGLKRILKLKEIFFYWQIMREKMQENFFLLEISFTIWNIIEAYERNISHLEALKWPGPIKVLSDGKTFLLLNKWFCPKNQKHLRAPALCAGLIKVVPQRSDHLSFSCNFAYPR